MTSAWCSIEDAAEHLGVSRKKLVEAIEDSARAGLEVPVTDHGTANKKSQRFCVALLDEWMLEVGRWRRSESSRAASGKSDGVTPMVILAPSPRRRRRRATSSISTSRDAKSSDKPTNPMRAKLRALESTTP